MQYNGFPPPQGLYDPQHEHDACGIGFVANIKGKKTNDIVHQALTMLENMDHRAGHGSEPTVGDGAGILLQIPHQFFARECENIGIHLGAPENYGVGMVFLSRDPEIRRDCEEVVENIVEEEGQLLLGWRTVPVDNSMLGKAARVTQPHIRQLFIGKGPDLGDGQDFERKLYIIRRRAEKEIREAGRPGEDVFYFASLSSTTIVYKGMLTTGQIAQFYVDLQDPAVETALALIHSRFSTNTFPSWERAHPYRHLVHNGEINTLRGNVNWMHARQGSSKSDVFGDDFDKLLPVIDPWGSDSAMFDNVIEFLILSGRSLPHVAMMLIPEPWTHDDSMSAEKRAFYEYHSCLMEPWDGPASVVMTDGKTIVAQLDRNGLRPSRYYVTDDDLIVLASEVGALEIPPEKIIRKERLHPGRMLVVDTEKGVVVPDDEVKHAIATEHPYEEWLMENLIGLEDLPEAASVPGANLDTLVQRQQAFGYSFEEVRKTLMPMASEATDPIGAMGNDIPLAVLSRRPQLLYNYFKQLFAQVTNPPIDAIREELVTSVETTIGPEGNLVDPQPASCRHIRLKTPLLTNAELAKLRNICRAGFKSVTLPILFNPAKGGSGLAQALDSLCVAADEAIDEGATFLILSDRDVHQEQAAIPALLAVSCVHHHLIRAGTRTKVDLLVESGEPREVHHFALLLGYGASAINPYLTFETLVDLVERDLLPVPADKAIYQYVKGAIKGIVKVISKMGISTIQSYRGAQIFEAIGLEASVIEQYFTWTPSRVGGVDLDVLAKEVQLRHDKAFTVRTGSVRELESGGEQQWRKDGELHLYNPQSIYTLQQACRSNDYSLFKEYADLINHQERERYTLRGLMEFASGNEPIPIEEVESVDSIVKRFKTGAMSYGSISQEAHEALAIAMNRLGGKSNTGEGGEDPARFTPDENGDFRRSAIKQVASGRFGVTSNYLVNANEIQIKMAQGAKPGEGGQLPGRKVYPWIAAVRQSTPGVGLISPPPHHDIYSIEDLAELIYDLKNANRDARISVKLVSEVGVGTVAAGVAKGKADVVLISGYDGGTGASPRTSIRHAGLPWELGLAETHQTLVLNDLRDRIVIECDGKLMTGRDVAIAAMLGAEEFGFATAPLVALGCVMMRVCHLDTCPVGIATQNPELRKKFNGDPQYVVNFMRFIAQQVREIMAELGFRTVNEMVGRTDKLQVRSTAGDWKTQGLDLSVILAQPDVSETIGRYCRKTQDHSLEQTMDMQTLLPLCQPALDGQKPVLAVLPIRNTHRAVGTILGSEVTQRYGAAGLPDDTIQLRFQGSAGQSFGAFVPKGITLSVEGDANDYVGKGLSGGKVIVYPPEQGKFRAEENVIIGNVAFYGATSGEAYIRGLAGERFCVRNSGAHAVVEGVGDHGCEYMTGGRVVVLGTTGRNFAAGMSGGIAYVLDADGSFEEKCNTDMVLLETLVDEEEIRMMRDMIRRHVHYTGSTYAWQILKDWDQNVHKFVKVIPEDFQRMMEAIDKAKAMGLSEDAASMAAFEGNMTNIARVSGR